MIITKVKQDLRINHSQLDNDINDTIDSCIRDLSLRGINVDKNNLSNIEETAIKLYCRAWYDFGGNAEQCQANYDKLVIALAITSEVENV